MLRVSFEDLYPAWLWDEPVIDTERQRREMERLEAERSMAMRRVAPKGTYVPAKLAKAKGRVAPEVK